MRHCVVSTSRRVCVIGAGVSGLVAAKVLVQAGHHVTIFERDTDAGGVWIKARAYPGLTTQTPGEQYAFSDFPVPEDHRGWPSAQRIVEYLERYAVHFEIARLVRFGQQVVDVRRSLTSGAGWSVTVVDSSGICSAHRFDFVVVCNGTFHTPRPISVPGVERFYGAGGMVLHSSECTDPEVLTGKRVVVVGFGKSATDIACYAADRAESVYLVVRRPVWPVPKVLGGVLPVRWTCTSRLWEWLMPHRPPQRWVARRVHRATLVLWRVVETVLARQFHLDRCGLRPAHGFADQVTTGFLLSPDRLYDLLVAGRIRCVRSSPERFTERGITLSGDVHLDADVVVLGIGYQQVLPFLDSSVRANIIDLQGRFRLYRHLVNPDVPDLGFVGYNNSLFTPVTSEVGARWLAAYLANRIELPDAATMHREIDLQLDIGTRARPLIGKFTGVNVAPYTYDYLDTLLRDLGETTRFSGLRRLWTFIKPFDPADFAPKHPPVAHRIVDPRICGTATSSGRKR
jgi:dimethylaniline monooxygenase (N-oxide forming)